jgi:hypothetical protein
VKKQNGRLRRQELLVLNLVIRCQLMTHESTENSRSQKELTGKVWETMALLVERTRECYQRRSRALSG